MGYERWSVTEIWIQNQRRICHNSSDIKSSRAQCLDVTVGHLLVIYKGIHEKPFIDELLPLGLLISQVSVVIVGDDDAVWLIGQLDDEAVVIANHASALDAPRRSEDQDLFLLKATQDFLICVWEVESDVEVEKNQNPVLELSLLTARVCVKQTLADLLLGHRGGTALSSTQAQTLWCHDGHAPGTNRRPAGCPGRKTLPCCHGYRT